MGMSESPYIKACYGRNQGRIPVWIMRQAGRYLPEYRAVREKVSFLELCKSPELIAEVVRQPVERFGLDAAILFSDILILLEPMGIALSFPDGGPKIANPVNSPDDVRRLKNYDVAAALPFVAEGIRQIKRRMPDTPLIGFAGSPFTLACYLIQGKGSKDFDLAKRFMHEYPAAAEELITFLSDITAKYLELQIDAGADSVQIFESWGGVLSKDDFCDWSARPVNEIFGRLKHKRVPRALFVNNVAPYLDVIGDIDCEVVGVDYRIDLAQAAAALPHKAVQGNLDPSALFESPDRVRERTIQILDAVENHDNLIFNLGHGIQPHTPIASVEAVVETVHGFRS
ncbi:uroporphyrinogen decarboxylase [candidate division GN15 bacterium]|uniref:Uroporphyrinogen decarboxylase n=1 Tax=candidate division GN15 bacterium TaxID=2072418 RepID=A0A855X6W2_9BACT|nr:MAG: uroporphyrinogen decarboxylase [candidate division GN15 bacterium]